MGDVIVKKLFVGNFTLCLLIILFNVNYLFARNKMVTNISI